MYQASAYSRRLPTVTYHQIIRDNLPTGVTTGARLLPESAYRNGVPIGPVSTWVCRNEDGPDREVVITRLATDEEIEREGKNGRLITR